MGGIDIKRLKRGSTAKPTPGSGVTTDILGWLQRDITLFEPFGDKQKEAYYHGMAMLLQAGMDIKAAFELLSGQQRNKKVTAMLATLSTQVVQGSTLSDAMQQLKPFTPYEYFSVQIGEETGKLAEVMEGLAIFFGKRLKQKRQLTGAMTYPAIVTLTSLGAVFFMMNFIVPMFGDIFHRSGSELPAITQLIVSISAWFRAYAIWVIAALLAIAGWLFSQRKQTWFRKYAASLLLRLPLFGPIIRQVHLARLCNAMALLTGSRVPLIRALGLSRQMVGYYPIEHSLQQVEDDLLHGKSLHQSLAAFPIYDSRLVALVKVGEEVNQLAGFFAKIAEQYNADIEYRSATLSALMEPFIIIFLGFFVGLILIAMYLPLFQMGSNIN